jgi:hypothetical protein
MSAPDRRLLVERKPASCRSAGNASCSALPDLASIGSRRRSMTTIFR